MSKVPTLAEIQAAYALCSELPLLMNRLDQAGLHRTARKMHEVIEIVGFETANLSALLEGSRVNHLALLDKYQGSKARGLARAARNRARGR